MGIDGKKLSTDCPFLRALSAVFIKKNLRDCLHLSVTSNDPFLETVENSLRVLVRFIDYARDDSVTS